MDPLRRKILEAGAAAAAMATASRVLAQAGSAEGAMTFYERGPVRIHYEVAGSGFPLMLIAGGGLNSTISGLKNGSPFNPIDEFKGEYRCIAADLRNANGGNSSGPLEVDRPWDAYTDDHIGLMSLILLQIPARQIIQVVGTQPVFIEILCVNGQVAFGSGLQHGPGAGYRRVELGNSHLAAHQEEQ